MPALIAATWSGVIVPADAERLAGQSVGRDHLGGDPAADVDVLDDLHVLPGAAEERLVGVVGRARRVGRVEHVGLGRHELRARNRLHDREPESLRAVHRPVLRRIATGDGERREMQVVRLHVGQAPSAAAVAPSICGTWVKFVSSLPKVDSPTVNVGMPFASACCDDAGHARAVLRLDREAVDLVGVEQRVDLVDLLVHVLLGLGRTQPRALDRVDVVRDRQRVVVPGLILLREALDRARSVREDVVDRLMGLDLGDGRRREREGATVPQRDGPAGAADCCRRQRQRRDRAR